MCALPSAPWSCPLRRGPCARVSARWAPSAVQGLCDLLPSPQACPLRCKLRVTCRGLYAVLVSLSRPALCGMGFLWVSPGSPGLPSGEGHSPWAVYGLRSASCSVFCPLGPCFAQLSPLGPPVRNSPVHRKSSFLRTPSLPWAQAPVQKFSISSLFKSPSSK